MTAEIIKLQKKKSRYGGFFYYVFFKSLMGKSYYTCVYERMRNYSRWKKVLDVGVTLTGLKLSKKKPNLIDADSSFKKIGD